MGKNKKSRNKGQATEERLKIKTILKDKELEAIEKFQLDIQKSQGHYFDKQYNVVEEKSKATYIRVFPSCKRCYKRGYVGFDIKLLMVIPCSCLIERLDKKSIS